MNKRHILSEIKRTAAANGGKPLGVSRFSQETGIQQSDWRGKIWARWGDALQDAGFEPNQLQTAYDEDVLIEKFIGLARDLGRFPTAVEVKMRARSEDAFPWHNTFARFGKKQQFAKKIMAYCSSRAGYEDIAALCAPFVAQPASAKDDMDEIAPEDESIGFVYLMKSGRYYKIGRSNAAGRREYELAIQMPEKLTTIHTIRTDDPPGIDDSWHRRFAAGRKNGEWFDLTSLDVKAFKRRKFM
jgi:Meiotically up-regulated gene 113